MAREFAVPRGFADDRVLSKALQIDNSLSSSSLVVGVEIEAV